MADRKIDLSKKYWSPIREEKRRKLAQRTEKWCNHCQTVKPLDKFYQPSASGLTGYSAWCKECCRERQREKYWERKARRKQNQR